MFADYSGKRKNYQKIKWILRERTSIFLLFILKNKKKIVYKHTDGCWGVSSIPSSNDCIAAEGCVCEAKE